MLDILPLSSQALVLSLLLIGDRDSGFVDIEHGKNEEDVFQVWRVKKGTYYYADCRIHILFIIIAHLLFAADLLDPYWVFKIGTLYIDKVIH